MPNRAKKPLPIIRGAPRRPPYAEFPVLMSLTICEFHLHTRMIGFRASNQDNSSYFLTGKKPEPPDRKMDTIRIGIITSSDRASKGEYEDLSGPAIKEYWNKRIVNPVEWTEKVVPDEPDLLQETLISMCDDSGCSLICTTGGTGPAKRDVTPEATAVVCEKILPGFGESMRKVSLQYVPTAILSRQTAGIRGNTLIINLPGKPKAIAECLDGVVNAIPYCIDLIEGPRMEFRAGFEKPFRPGGKKK